MQLIHRTPCQDKQSLSALCLADYMASLIDERAPPNTVEDARSTPADQATTSRAASGTALIWVESEQALGGGNRGMIVAGHGPAPARPLVISYPLGTNSERRCLHAVSDALEKIGWSVVAFRCRRTGAGRANVAILVNNARPGGEHRLIITAQVHAAGHRHAPPMHDRRVCVARQAAPINLRQRNAMEDRKARQQAVVRRRENGVAG